MPPLAKLALLIPIAYMVGSVPFGLLVGLAKGVDPRTAGSGNIGATNVARLIGGKFFAVVFSLDLLKGLAPVLAAGWLAPRDGAGIVHGWPAYTLWLAVGLFAILGHMFSLFIGFKGGKGVATSAGVILGVFPYLTYPALVGIAVWLIVFLAKRYVSLASMIGAACIPAAYIAIGLTMRWQIVGQQTPLLIFTLVVATLVIVKHRGNIARLRAGTEHAIGRRAG